MTHGQTPEAALRRLNSDLDRLTHGVANVACVRGHFLPSSVAPCQEPVTGDTRVVLALTRSIVTAAGCADEVLAAVGNRIAHEPPVNDDGTDVPAFRIHAVAGLADLLTLTGRTACLESAPRYDGPTADLAGVAQLMESAIITAEDAVGRGLATRPTVTAPITASLEDGGYRTDWEADLGLKPEEVDAVLTAMTNDWRRFGEPTRVGNTVAVTTAQEQVISARGGAGIITVRVSSAHSDT